MSLTTKERPLPDDQGQSDRPEWLTKSTTPTFCYRHPDRQTGLRCSRCDRPICGECANPAPVGQLCPDDAKSTVRVRGLPGTERPLATYTILAINTVMLFAAALLSGDAFGLLQPANSALCRLGALNAAAIAESGQWWRLLTVMVLHGGLLHWAFNSWALWAFGPALESMLGRARFVALYVGTGLVGAGASFAFNQTTLGVGASGAIFGLLGALVAYFFRRRREGGSAPLQNLLLVLLLNLFIASRSASIDNMAHIGGFLAGLAAMALYDAVGPRNRSLQAAALAVPFLAGVVLAVLGVANYPPGSGLTCVGA
ncbi:MAG TPA: rhomboid family intramembrane serine protease [Actinomycetota bacterium]|nr:rhomboid family intramembrane serine protease [Actinomycetota bacterium]